MKILVTGAHFTTAVAVIEELQKQSGVEIVYVGRKTTREGDSSPSPESKVLPEMGVKFIPLTTGRLQRTFTPYTIPSLLKVPFGFLQAIWILLKEKPDAILSFGGYVAVPVVIAGWLMSIPIMIHEQTIVTGLANKISSFFATKIAVSFPVKNDFNKKKVILTGNPLRKEIITIIPAKAGFQKTDSNWIPDHPKGTSLFEVAQVRDDNSILKLFKTGKKEKLPVILITGGNQGSHVINEAVEKCLDKLIKIACVIHQTGDSKFGDYEKLEAKQGERYIVQKFIYSEMPYILANTDLVVGRAGINTLSELAYLGTPAIVIPVPYLHQDEQNKNAKYFEELGLVKTLPQSKLNGQSLLENIKEILKDLTEIRKQAKNAKEMIIPDAAKRLALETVLLV